MRNNHLRLSAAAAMLVFLCAPPSRGAALDIKLNEMEKRALDSSARLKSAVYDHESAKARAAAMESALYPRLSIEGTYRYNSSVPEIDLPIPGMLPRKFGDNTNYSFGPAAS